MVFDLCPTALTGAGRIHPAHLIATLFALESL